MKLQCDIAIIGGSFGGVAAALAACEAGYRVVLTEATDWLGGQVTSQGVSPLDEHALIETFGGTHRYYEFRNKVRSWYRTRYGAPAQMPDGAPLNPGNGWVSRLCFEPKVGLAVLEEMLAPHREGGRLTVLLEHRPVAATVRDATVMSLSLLAPGGERLTVHASYFLDATDLGELLPLTGTALVTGAESCDDTGEPHARPGPANPREVQSFTFPFAVEVRPGKRHVIPKPPGYAHHRCAQPYTLELSPTAGYRMFKHGPHGEPPFWSYRRVIDEALLGHPAYPHDIALINWAGNDYRFKSLLEDAEQGAAALDEAKRLALGFLYWLQTACPRDEGGFGYPELKLRPDVLGTTDGLAKAPYIRESRRLVALERVVEQDITPSSDGAARAKHHPSSVGIG